jgi:molybdopterin converting factor small subunit
MAIHVELFGLPRHRTGVTALNVEASTLGGALREAGRLVPALADVCLTGERLRAGYLVSLNGRTFVSDPATPLAAGDSVLIVSSDPGG